LPFPERRLVLMALDLLAVSGALLLALALVMQIRFVGRGQHYPAEPLGVKPGTKCPGRMFQSA